jgi:hypothetical protein
VWLAAAGLAQEEAPPAQESGSGGLSLWRQAARREALRS